MNAPRRRNQSRAHAASILDCAASHTQAEPNWKFRSGRSPQPPAPYQPVRKIPPSRRRWELPPRRNVCHRPALRCPGGCRHRSRANKSKHAAGGSATVDSSESCQLCGVWCGRPAIRSRLTFSRPAFRRNSTARPISSRRCMRPAAASSVSWNDCAPRLTRLMPADFHAAELSA